MDFFKFAKPIFVDNKDVSLNFQVGFYREFVFDAAKDKKVTVCVTAKNIFRLYINGKTVLHGPARTAHGYARVDKADITGFLNNGVNHIACEVLEYGREAYGHYSNDSTLEDGFFILELYDIDMRSVLHTDENWSVYRIKQRVSVSERISHSRESAEVYYLDGEYRSWRVGNAEYKPAVIVNPQAEYLPHNALRATLYEHDAENIVEFGFCEIDKNYIYEPSFYEASYPEIYKNLPERTLYECQATVEYTGADITCKRGEGIELCSDGDKYILFDMRASFVGFPYIEVETEREGIIDLIPTELLSLQGKDFYGSDCITRLHVKSGKTEFCALEPTLCRYFKIYFRNTGKVKIIRAGIKEYFYPDENRSSFMCSDDDINRLYDAAKRTLLLNTMDIFMDCPQRERGGWLCDSLWSGRAAALMLSDDRVEREFIENFLLTDPDKMYYSIFPEAYPGNKKDYRECAGLINWSFWLMCEFCEFVYRTGDMNFANTYYKRVEAFVNGMLKLKGSNQLIENLNWLFIDWSCSNNADYQRPISVPANILFAYTLKSLGELYDNKEWLKIAGEMKNTLKEALVGYTNSEVKVISDNLRYVNGKLCQTDKYSEAALYTDLWCNLFEVGENKSLDAYVRDCMGPAPKYIPAPYIGRSGLFIGLCIRLDMLSRRGYYDKLYEDILAICMPQLKEGPGTLWENEVSNTSSRCHGFMSHIGVHFIRDILGMGMENKLEKQIKIAPHLCNLRWARGTHEIDGEIMSLSWSVSDDGFELKAMVPKAYGYTVELPASILAMGRENIHVEVNGKKICFS